MTLVKNLTTKAITKFTTMLLLIAVLFTSLATPVSAAIKIEDQEIVSIVYDEVNDIMTTTVNSETLITNVSMPANGMISFLLSVPAGETVEYTVELIPHPRMGSIDTKSGVIENTGTSMLYRTITVPGKYYSDGYTITATYYTGPARDRTIYTDTDSARCGVITPVYSDVFVWDADAIARYNAGQTVGILLTFGVTATVDIMATKGYLSGAYGVVLTYTMLTGDVYSELTDGGTQIQNITSEPIAGWAYQFKLEPGANGAYSKLLIVYDEFGRLYNTYLLGTYTLNGVSLGIY